MAERAKLGALKVSLGMDTAQFTRSVADINRRLKGVKSEFDAASDGSREFANSTEGLKAKQDMLNRTLELQDAKLKELKRRYEDSKRVKGEDDRATQNLLIQYNKARGSMNKTERRIKEVNQALEENRNEVRKAGKALDELGDKIEDVGEEMQEAGGKMSGTFSVAGAAVGGFAGKIANDLDASRKKIQQYFGSTEQEAEALNEIVSNLWEQGFGENMAEVNDALIQVKQNMRGIGTNSEIETATRHAIRLADIYESDVNEVTRAGAQLMKTWGLEADEAFDYMAYGAQNGLNFSNEMFDNLSEYIPLYKDMGFSADEYFNMMISGAEAGVYNFDYLNDAMKEFQVRAIEGGDNVEEVMAGMSKETQQLWKEFKNGDATIRDLHQRFIWDLAEMTDGVEANRRGVELYGTKWEDVGLDTMIELGNIEGELSNLDSAMERSGDTVEKTFGEKAKIAWRGMQEDIIPLGEKLIELGEDILPKVVNAVEKGVDWFNDLSPAMQNTALAVGAIATVAGPVVVTIGGLVAGIGGLASAAGGAAAAIGIGGAGAAAGTGLLAGLGAIAGPALIAVGAVAAVGAATYGLVKAMKAPVMESKVFSKEISDSTQKVLGSYLELDEEASIKLNNLAFTQTEITDKMKNDLVGTYAEMNEKILTSMDENHAEVMDRTQKFFEMTDELSDEQEKMRMEKVTKAQEAEREQLQINQDRIKGILETAAEEKRALTQEEADQIAAIQENMRNKAVEEMSKSEKEQMIIAERLKNQKGIIETEQLVETVNRSKKAREGVVKEAEKKYEEVIAEAIYQRDELGTISQSEYEDIVRKAEMTKNETIRAADEKHRKIVNSAHEQAGEHADQVNWEAGRVLSTWESIGNGIIKATNWVRTKIFKMDALPLIGSLQKQKYSYDGRQPKATGVQSYAEGTKDGQHLGGPAIVGEEGPELAHIPNRGLTVLGEKGPEFIHDLPKGSSVLPNKHTENLLKRYGFPAYAGGIGDYFDWIFDGAGSIWNKVKGMFKIGDAEAGKSKINNAFGSISGMMSKGITDVIQGYIDEFMGGFGSGGSFKGIAGPQQVREWVIKALSITNTPMSWLPAMMVKAQKESGYNPRAINLWDINAKRGTPSKGLFQTIDPTFNAYKMKGMNDIYNPIHNAVAAIRYIKSRYGTVFNTPGIRSMARGGGYKGYSEGGFIRKEQLAWLGEGDKDEVVIPLEQHRERAQQLWVKAGEELDMLGNFKLKGNNALSKYFNAIFEDGDWANDWLTHLPKSQQSSVRSMGKELATALETSYTSNLSQSAQAFRGTIEQQPQQNTSNSNYNVTVNYSGSTSTEDMEKLAQEIKRALQQQEREADRSYGVV